MVFLILPNGRSLRKSMKGCRFHNRFLNRIEEECCVFLPLSFYAKKWNLQDFVAYVEKRKQRPGVDLRMATDNLESYKWHYQLQLLFLTLIVTSPLVIAALQAFLRLPFPVGWIILAVPVAINCVHSGAILGQIF